jgi:hypothetical protein
MIDILDAVLAINPEAKCTVSNNDIDTIIWDSGQTPISKADIEAKQTELQTEYDSQDYARNRKAEYDQLNQFEMQFDDKENNTTTWVDKINEIKGRHPK